MSGARIDQASALEEQQVVARRLVGSLDAAEIQILECLVRGMSTKATAAFAGIPVDDVNDIRASMMKKLNATRTVDAIRVGLYAGLDLLN